MTTPRKPWPPEWAAQYHDVLATARRIAALATGCIEYCLETHNVYLLHRWLKLIQAKGLEIQNSLGTVYRGRRHMPAGQPVWVIEALEMLTIDSEEIVHLATAALEHLDGDNWEALEVEVPRCLALGLVMEKYLLAGPPPAMDEGDVLDQVRELVETFEEEA